MPTGLTDVMVGVTLFTLSMAGAVGKLPPALVKTASYSSPFWLPDTLFNVSVSLVAPATGVQLCPPSALICQATFGIGQPIAPAVKLAVPKALVVVFDGFAVIVSVGTAVSTTSFPLAPP